MARRKKLSEGKKEIISYLINEYEICLLYTSRCV